MRKTALFAVFAAAASMALADVGRQAAIPSLERYAEANKSVRPGRIVMFGDSITDNWPGRSEDFFTAYGLVGRGIAGQTSIDMMERFGQDVLALRPKTVVILAGTNDMAENRGPITPEEAAANIASMCERAKKGKIRVVLCSVLPVAKYGWREEITDAPERVRKLNALLKGHADRLGVEWIDYYSALADEKGGMGKNAPDGVHPDATGYGKMEKILVDALKLSPGNGRAQDVAYCKLNTEAKVWNSPDGGTLNYRIHVPENAKGKVPLVLFLHGAGERGTNNWSQLVHCGRSLVEYARTVEPAIVVMPQCPQGKRWAEIDWHKTEHSQPEMSDRVRMVFEILDDAMKTLPVDKSRVYVCGISMGGYGTWDVLCRRPDLFAAAIPCCGGGDPKVAAEKLAAKPIWTVHGDADVSVPVENSRRMVKAVRDAGNRQALYTEWAGAEHNVWTRTFADRYVLDWLFNHRLAPQ